MTRPRSLAHSYRDELPPPRPTIEPVRVTWRDAAEIVIGTAVLSALFVGILLVLFLAGPA